MFFTQVESDLDFLFGLFSQKISKQKIIHLRELLNLLVFFLCVKLPFYIIWKTLEDDQHIISINFSQQKYNKRYLKLFVKMNYFLFAIV